MPCKKTQNRTPRKRVLKSKAVRRAISLSRRFYGFEPRRIKRIGWRWPKAVAHIGRCSQINYVSDKFDGKVREYFHEFTHTCQVFAPDKPQPNGDQVLIIRGKFNLRREGIVG